MTAMNGTSPKKRKRQSRSFLGWLEECPKYFREICGIARRCCSRFRSFGRKLRDVE
jgi:hypothetical protein